MKYLSEYKKWESTATNGTIPKYDFTSDGKIYYGVHKVIISREGRLLEVEAKFDTGARSSSIDFTVAEELGISKELIDHCKKLDHLDIPKDISKSKEKKLEKKYKKELKSKFKEVSSVQMSKSSSGFSLRAYISCKIEYNGNIVTTEVNLRDRTGMSCKMIVGLKDML